jgi:glutamine---fructose-6-phosphate transaminase (isomerizing)
MCGIIAVVRKPGRDHAPDPMLLLADLARARTEVAVLDRSAASIERLEIAANNLATVNAHLMGPAGTSVLLTSSRFFADVEVEARTIAQFVEQFEQMLDADTTLSARTTEQLSAGLIRVKDEQWALERDRLRTARGVASLAPAGTNPSALEALWTVQIALSALDRLEVRGRDSAGLNLLVSGHNLDLESPTVRALLDGRLNDPVHVSGAVELGAGSMSFVYKVAAEIGELGDNTAALRAAIANDALLHAALDSPVAEIAVLGHTRWASVGVVSEPNAHPLHQRQGEADAPLVLAALNGDVDNYAELKVAHRLNAAPEVTTDAKVIPVLISRELADGVDVTEAVRSSVAQFEGSVAIGVQVGADPNLVSLALRGSGQALYIGLSEDAYIVASEPYGVVELASEYLRMDGESLVDEMPASRGQVVTIDRRRAGTIEGIERVAYDGTVLPVRRADLVMAGVTTRDIDRGDAPHFLLKELTESPRSFMKTLRGKIRTEGDLQVVDLGEDTIPRALVERIEAGGIRRVLVIGQGTAAIAGQSMARLLDALLVHESVRVEPMLATELSGFGLTDDMSDTLVVAVSQSGTTTDTNRTVDIARGRGATVLAIVNRRGSDLTDRVDGVLYTSDGRDVEMSVASTKAFYAQIAAGSLLSLGLATAWGAVDTRAAHELLVGLQAMPAALTEVLASRPGIAVIAKHHAPANRYWAIVGSGANRIAAEEVRIKLSELCYKSIACDAIEDKKHIDLSSEPMILVCAAGLRGSNAADMAKEVAIYRAHKAVPIVVATEGESTFENAVDLITVPPVHEHLDFLLSAMVGHLFGYEAALAIDAGAQPLRELRARIETVAQPDVTGEELLAELRDDLRAASEQFSVAMRAGSLDGHLPASVATKLAVLLRYGAQLTPLESYQFDFGRVGTPALVLEDLTTALSDAIDELTRPVDAIKHQAKTVTVGISRSDETLLQTLFVREALSAGVARERLTYSNLQAMAALDAAIESVTGVTRYSIEGSIEDGSALIEVIDRSGVSLSLRSRTGANPVLRGTKRRVAAERKLLVAAGRADGRTIVLIPETKGAEVTGITLMHVQFRERMDATAARTMLQRYRDRYAVLRDAVTETEPTFREDLLADTPVLDLLISPISELADHWRTGSSDA